MKKITALLGVMSVFALTTLQATAFFGSVEDMDNTDSSNGKVQNVTINPDDGAVILLWDEVQKENGEKAEKYRVDYGNASIAGGSATEYPLNAETIDNLPSKKISNLDSAETYYFTVTGIYADGSESDPSTEVSGTALAGNEAAALSEELLLSNVMATGANGVEVQFSKDIVLPSDAAGAFSIQDPEENFLAVTAAEIASNPSAVRLTTANQTAGTSYTLVVSATVTDTAGNPIQSGSTDTLTFKGYTAVAADPEETTDPTAETDPVTTTEPTEGEVVEPTETTTTTTSTTTATENPGNTTQKENDAIRMADISAIKTAIEQVYSDESMYPETTETAVPSYIIEIPGDPETGEDYYYMAFADPITSVERQCYRLATKLTDPANAAKMQNDGGIDPDAYEVGPSDCLDIENDTAPLFKEDPLHGTAEDPIPSTTTTAPVDTTAPEDVTNLDAIYKARINDFLVTLSWTPSVDSDGDLADQKLYRREKGETWNEGSSIGADVNKITQFEKPETEIDYKVTVSDEAGNESVGAIRSVALPALPQTGAPLFFIAGAALLGAAGMMRRKKK